MKPIRPLSLAWLFICLTGLLPGNSSAQEDSRYLDAVRTFADNVLKYGRDTYGPKKTPLFVDGLNIHTHEPVKWITPDGEEWIVSNLSSQQNLFRTLDGLSRVTGDPKYREAAEEAIRYAFENIQSPSGLFYWGGHAAYDAKADKPCGRMTHELKGFYPYYELMWKINPEATRQFIETFWAGHILDWSSLSMNRHYYKMGEQLKTSWDHDYDPAPVFTGGGFSPSSTGADLYYAAAWLSRLSGEKKPLTWGKRLAYRYVETRHPNTGISARVFTGTGVQSNDEVLSKLKPVEYTFPWQGHANRALWESHFGYDTPTPGTMINRVTAPWICQLMLGELLGSDGKEFIQWPLEELTAWGKVAYRREDNTFVPMCYDGTVVEGYVCKEDCPLGLKGSKLEAVPVKITELWAYTLAYCLTKDAFMWEMARNIALANDFGDLGASVDDQPKLNLQTASSDPYAMVVFLELHRRTGQEAFLKMAQRIGNNILAHRFYKDLVSPDGQYTFTKFDAIDPLALLHLHAALIGDKSMNVPNVWPGTSFFEEAYRSKDPVDDNQLIYSLKGVSEPPRSLQEAAAEGDVEAVKSMIAQGVDVDSREDGFRNTALHRAAIDGHQAVAKLLIESGARLDAKDAWPGGTPLHYAAENGHKEVVELLLAEKADINSISSSRYETPLHCACRSSHKEIVELLVAAGADTNAKNGSGLRPIDIARRSGNKEILELLQARAAKVSIHEAAKLGALAEVKGFLDKGVDINARDGKGRTPIHLAAQRGNKDIVDLLINKGADVNAKNDSGETPLDIGGYHKEIAQLLMSAGARTSSIHRAALWGLQSEVRRFLEEEVDVNAKNEDGWAPLHLAAQSGHKDVMELLIAKGADVNARNAKGQTPLHLAIRNRDLEAAKESIDLLLSRGADLNAKDDSGCTLLDDVALGHFAPEIFDFLLSKGADANNIHFASYHGDVDRVKSFLKEGVDINEKRTTKERTPLDYAVKGRQVEVVKLLISEGADVKNDTTAFLNVVQYGNTEIAKLLLNNGANPNAVGGGLLRRSILHIAVFGKNKEMVQLLIKNGADVNAKVGGRTALDLAKMFKNTEIINLLKKHGAKE